MKSFQARAGGSGSPEAAPDPPGAKGHHRFILNALQNPSEYGVPVTTRTVNQGEDYFCSKSQRFEISWALISLTSRKLVKRKENDHEKRKIASCLNSFTYSTFFKGQHKKPY